MRTLLDRCPSALLVALLATAACASSSGPASPDGGAAVDGGTAEIEAAERDCERTLVYRPSAQLSGVQVAGSWDWNNPRNLVLRPDNTYAIELGDLAPGLYSYKFVVNGAWILDPDNDYRAYENGVENSGLRLADCSLPLIDEVSASTTASSLEITATLFRGVDGAALDRAKTEITLWSGATQISGADIDIAAGTGRVTISATGLTPGKYTARLTTTDTANKVAKAVLVPVWVEAEAFDWRDATIYMVMVDRYRNGNPANDPAPGSAAPSADWHGGDLAGITQAIEAGELDELGIRAIWLSPFIDNAKGVYQDGGNGVSAYHGYWPTKARAIDPRFGTEAELEALVDAAHARGIRILLDYVLNHVHEDHEYLSEHPEWFRTGCKCGDAGCGWTERRLDCLFQPYLPDVDWTQTAASDAFIDDALWWLERFDLDGLRVDAVKHVEDLAVFNLGTRVNETFERGGTDYFLLGETAMGWNGHVVGDNASEYGTISRYIGDNGLSGQFDFVLYHAAAYNVFAYGTYGLAHADFWAQQSLASYPESAIMTPFVGSHDSSRFVSMAAGDGRVNNKWPSQGLPTAPTDPAAYAKMRLALTWVLTQPGAPLLYYGDEYGEFGGADPDNRHMWRNDSERTTAERDLRAIISRLGVARKDSVALRRGTYQSLVSEDDVLIFGRSNGTESAFVALNRSGAAASRTITLSASAAAAATYTDALSDDTFNVSGNSLTISIPAGSSRVLVRAP